MEFTIAVEKSCSEQEVVDAAAPAIVLGVAAILVIPGKIIVAEG